MKGKGEKMKKLFKGLLVAAMALTVTACGGNGSENTADNSASSNKEVKEINIAVSPDYAPYESLDTDGNIIGFDPDMVALFPSYLNDDNTEYKFVWHQMSFDNIVSQVQSGQVDLGVSGFTYDEKRKVEWSIPYTATAQVAVVNKNSDIKTIADLEGKIVAAQSGSTGENAAKEIKNAKVVSVSNVQEIFSALTSQQYDAVVVDLAVAQNYVKEQGFVMLDESLLDEKNYIIAKEGNEEMISMVNQCLEKFLASDDYAKLCEKYGLKQLEQ